MSSRFDELSKALASGMPRRTVLKLFVASVVGSAFTPWSRLSAEAARLDATVTCNPACKPGQICVRFNGNYATCVQSPCQPGEIYASFSGRPICISRHCNPPCKGDEVCVAAHNTSGSSTFTISTISSGSLPGRAVCVPRGQLV